MLKEVFGQLKKFSHIYAVGYMCWVFFRSNLWFNCHIFMAQRRLEHCQVIMYATCQLFRMNIDVPSLLSAVAWPISCN